MNAAFGRAAAGSADREPVESLEEYPPSQGADSLSMKKNIQMAMAKLESPHGSST